MPCSAGYVGGRSTEPQSGRSCSSQQLITGHSSHHNGLQPLQALIVGFLGATHYVWASAGFPQVSRGVQGGKLAPFREKQRMLSAAVWTLTVVLKQKQVWRTSKASLGDILVWIQDLLHSAHSPRLNKSCMNSFYCRENRADSL